MWKLKIKYLSASALHTIKTIYMVRTALIALFSFSVSLIYSQETLLLRNPSVSEDKIAFAYGGDIWVCAKDGSHPVRLTVNQSSEGYPVLSPDGKWVAFSG